MAASAAAFTSRRFIVAFFLIAFMAFMAADAAAFMARRCIPVCRRLHKNHVEEFFKSDRTLPSRHVTNGSKWRQNPFCCIPVYLESLNAACLGACIPQFLAEIF